MRRGPLEKEHFLEGIRQKWAVLFLLCGGLVLGVHLWVGNFDPTPYMQFLVTIGSLFILGASGDSWVKAYSVKSITETEAKEETKRTIAVIKDEHIPDDNTIMEYDSQHANDQSYAPKDWIDEQETTDFR
tara:strand:+ start:21047 stop:21436 length:390 start_codon:yes stop_codon:yes gene_type:complete